MKKTIILFLISFLLPLSALAVDYPVIAGIDITSSDITASKFIAYLFYLIIAVGSLLGVIILFIAGLEWVSAYGNAEAINSAKKKIITVFVGMTVLLSSYIAINTINPAILNVNIGLEENSSGEIIIPESKGVFLYKDVNYEPLESKLRIRKSRASLVEEGFYKKTSSIQIKQPTDFSLGAILFGETTDSDENTIPGTEFKGKCSYITGDIPNLNEGSGDQNDPPIGQNNLDSLIVFNGSAGGSIKVYNNYGCKIRTTDYCREVEEDSEWEDPSPCPPEEESSCSFSVSEFTKMEDIIENECTTEEASFKGDILSIEVVGRVGVLFRGLLIDGEEETKEACQYFDSGGITSCINMVKYGPFYKIKEGIGTSIFSPREIMLFTLD